MQFNQDKRIKISVPFLKDKTILYVDSRTGTSHFYVEQFRDEIQYKFEELGYTFLFLPEVCERLSPELIEYLFPGQEGFPFPENMYQQIQDLAKLNDQTGFLYKENRLLYFHAVDGMTDSALRAAMDEFLNYLYDRQSIEYSGIRFSKKSIDAEEDIRFSIQKMELPSLSSRDILHEENVKLPKAHYEFREEDILNPKTQEILDAWDDIERRFGISIKDLAVLLGYRTKLSRLYITSSNQIVLADWKNQPEIKLDDLTKALYFFYLKHPEGVVFKALPDFEKEVLHIYMNITGRDDIKGIHNSISALCAPYSSGRDSCVSRIRKAFRDIVGDDIAKKYYIDGPQGGVRKIAIDRDLVIWAH